MTQGGKILKLKNVFQRKENKYLLPQTVFDDFVLDLEQQMAVDEFGLHTILSLYYDTADYQLIKWSIDKPRYKEKFRIRAYEVPGPDSLLFLEIKKKVNGIVYKRRLALDYPTYLVWQQTGRLTVDPKEAGQIKREIDWLFTKYPHLAARVLIAYDRVSYFDAEDENFRVTFDRNIRWRDQNLDLSAGGSGMLAAPEIDVLMEVKALGAYPLWFVELLNKHQLRQSSFSKYAQVFQRHLFKKECTKHAG